MISTLAWIALALGVGSAVAIGSDIVLGRWQPMWIMDLVHPVTALYLGPIWVVAYVRRWRAPAGAVEHAQPDGSIEHSEVATAVSHCGAGCTLGDIVGGWIVLALGLTIAGQVLFAEYAVGLALAWTLGVLFQYFTIAPMRGLSLRDGLVAAAKVDTLSILAFQVGMFGWMAVTAKLLFASEPSIASPEHWLGMQIGMVLGFATAWPVNRRLLASGVKERMGAPRAADPHRTRHERGRSDAGALSRAA
jgi:Domain of unknown function (DUF4396)